MAVANDTDEVAALKRQIQMLHDENTRLKEQLYEKSKQLSVVQERQTVAEQVTAATQRRELDEEGHSLELPTDHIYEKLRRNLEEEHIYTKLLPIVQKETLRSQYTELTRTLDARVVAANMYQRNALTLRELQSIQSLRDRPVEAAETLLNIIMEQPDAVYLCFLDVLKCSEQQHIYQRLVEQGYRGFDDGTSHTSVIREHYVFLLETLDVKVSGLVGQLYSDHVISPVERDDISAEQTSFRANEKLLSVLSRKSPQQFQLFLDALVICGQRHVRNVISDRPERGGEGCDVLQPRGQLHTDVGEDVRVAGQYEELPEFPESSSDSKAHPGPRVIHTLPPPSNRIEGIARLSNELCILHKRDAEQIEVYTTEYEYLRCISIPELDKVGVCDIVACEQNSRLYLSNMSKTYIHVVVMPKAESKIQIMKWTLSEVYWGLSLMRSGHLLATSNRSRMLMEFNPDGERVRAIILDSVMVRPIHSIQLSSGDYVICGAGETGGQVCIVNSEGQIQQSYGSTSGGGDGLLNWPSHIAVDKDEYVFVADRYNIVLLNPSLQFVSLVLPNELSHVRTNHVFVDQTANRLYAASRTFDQQRSVVTIVQL